MSKIKVNDTLLKQAATKAFQTTCQEFDTVLQKSITSEIWEHPHLTYRRNGEVVDSPRDIVDMGDLRDSQELTFPSETQALYQWDVNHALPNHEGYTTKTGLTVPAKPWTEEAVNRFDFEESFARNL